MIAVQMSEDIRKYESKILGPFTLRQLICTTLGIAIMVLFAAILPGSFTRGKFILISFLASPAFLCGIYKIGGTPLEIYAIRSIYRMFLTPTKRKEKSENYMRVMLNEYNKQLEEQNIKKMTPAQRKRYIQYRDKNVITYSKKKKYKMYR